MSLFSASVCLHLLCLLLVSGSSSTVIKKESAIPSEHLNQLSSTQANCSTACDNGSVSENAPAPGVSKAGSSGDLGNTSLITQTTSPSNIISNDTQPHQSFSNSALFMDTTNITNQQSEGRSHSTNDSSSNQQLSPNHQHPSLETATGPAAVLPLSTTHSPTQFVRIGSSASTGTSMGTTAVPNQNMHTVILPVTSMTTAAPSSTTTTAPSSTTTTATSSTTTTAPSPTTTTAPSPTTTTAPSSTTTTAPSSTTTTAPTPTTTTAPSSTTTTAPSSTTTTAPSSTTTTAPTSTTTSVAPHSPTPVNATAKVAISVITGTGTNTSSSSLTATPQLSPGMPPIQTTSLTSGATTINVTSVAPPADDNKPFATEGAVVEALTSQLVDTASLLTVLLFGLLFFLVTVAVFVTQAYESYRRKDYTQVDYLINGMYTDSGV